MKEFGNKLYQLRKSKGLTQAQLAQELNISPSAIGNYEMGGRLPRPCHLMAICNYFSVSSDFLLGIERRPVDISELLIRLKFYYQQSGSLEYDGTPMDAAQIERLFDFLLLSANVIISEKGRALLYNRED